MGTEIESGFGLAGTAGWTVGGAIGGAIGAAAFGLLTLTIDPGTVEGAIPAIYGFDQSSALGMGLHLVHGAILGVGFGFLVTRPTVRGVLWDDAETEAISGTGLALRVVAAGFVYGLAVWAILPLLVLPIWTETIGTGSTVAFSAIAVESLVGHALFGAVLGLVFAAVVDLSEEPAADGMRT